VSSGGTSITAWQFTNLHGDVVATVNGSDAGTDSVSIADDFGNMETSGQIGTDRYGWLGSYQRPADNPAGIVLMGVRLYNAATGRFLSVDPMRGGNANAYDYCSGNAVNCNDTTGLHGMSGINCYQTGSANHRWLPFATVSFRCGVTDHVTRVIIGVFGWYASYAGAVALAATALAAICVITSGGTCLLGPAEIGWAYAALVGVIAGMIEAVHAALGTLYSYCGKQNGVHLSGMIIEYKIVHRAVPILTSMGCNS
jgi:RHS repeat-associated protein